MITTLATPYNASTNTGYGCIEFDNESKQVTNSVQRAVLQGAIEINGYAYKDSFDTLREYFGAQLQISILGYYIRFKDPVLLQLLLDNGIGDGDGITYERAQSVTSLTMFSGNKDITSFDELKEFTNVTTCPRFYWCTNLKTIDCTNITVFGHECLRNCKSLTTLGNVGEFTLEGTAQFSDCNNLELDKDMFRKLTIIPGNLSPNNYVITEMNLENVTGIGGAAFSNCTSLAKINIINAEHLGPFAFARTIIEKVEMNKIQTIANRAFEGCSNLKTVVIRQPDSVPSLDWGNNGFINATIYVPDSLLKDYKVADNWSVFANNIKPLSEYTE